MSRVHRHVTRIAVTCLVSTLASACDVLLPQFRGWETAVVNQSTAPYVVEARDPGDWPPRFYAVPVGATVVVDPESHGNLATEALTFYDPSCSELYSLDEDFTRGALVTIVDNGPPTVALERHIVGDNPPADFRTGEPSCEGAAQKF